MSINELLATYGSPSEIATNGLILLNLLGALVLGLLVGYERSYHGRAAGMRTYGLVCMASAALTIVGGYPENWFGGHGAMFTAVDPTRVIQGIVTGIGFLGAGVIMREGFSIRGLSTAASIWTTAAIGVTIGVGFYGAAIAAAVLSMLVMSGFRQLERALPHQTVMHLTLVFLRDKAPTAEAIRAQAKAHGFDIIDWGFHLKNGSGQFEYQLVLQASGSPDPMELVSQLAAADTVVEFRLSPSRI